MTTIEINNLKAEIKNKIPRNSFKGIYYFPIKPSIDTDDLAAMGRRIMFAHGSATSPALKMWVAPKNEVSYGFAIGVVTD